MPFFTFHERTGNSEQQPAGIHPSPRHFDRVRPMRHPGTEMPFSNRSIEEALEGGAGCGRRHGRDAAVWKSGWLAGGIVVPRT